MQGGNKKEAPQPKKSSQSCFPFKEFPSIREMKKRINAEERKSKLDFANFFVVE